MIFHQAMITDSTCRPNERPNCDGCVITCDRRLVALEKFYESFGKYQDGQATLADVMRAYEEAKNIDRSFAR